MRNPETRLPPRAPRSGRVASPRRSGADPNTAPFSSFLERDDYRQKRGTGRRRMFVISLGVHVVALAALLVYSVFDIEELFTPSVGVKMIRTSQLPPGVLPEGPVAPPPDPALALPPTVSSTGR